MTVLSCRTHNAKRNNRFIERIILNEFKCKHNEARKGEEVMRDSSKKNPFDSGGDSVLFNLPADEHASAARAACSMDQCQMSSV